MKSYEVLLFDVDGTLLDFDKAEERGIEALLLHYGAPAGPESRERYHVLNQGYWRRLELGQLTRSEVLFGRFEDFFDGFGICVDGREADRLYRETLDQSAFLVEGAKELLDSLRGRYEMYVITNGSGVTQRSRLRASGLDAYFGDLFISEEAGCEKPQPGFFDYCFEKMGRRDAERMLVIGDSISSDIRGGIACGIDTCWYNPHGNPSVGGVCPNMEIRELGELKKIL